MKKRDQARADRLRRTRDALFPGGAFQERGLGLSMLWPATASPFSRRSRGGWTPGRAGHQVIPAVNIGITCYPTVGGSGAVAAELGKQLARRGHAMHFISYRLPFRLGDFQQNIRFHEVDVSSYPLFEYPPHDLALAAKMAEVAREDAPRPLPRPLRDPPRDRRLPGAADARRRAPPKLITTLHGTDITLVGQDRSFFEITRFGIERSDGVTAVSEFLRRMTVRGVPGQSSIETIPTSSTLERTARARAYATARVRRSRRRRCSSTSRTSAR